MKTAVEWLHSEYKRILGSVLVTPQQIIEMSDALENAKEIERGQLLNMSLKSAHHERKWILEHSTESKYNPSKVEMRDLEKTALEHYNETFKQQEQ